MSELVVVGFKNDEHKASLVLDELRVLDSSWALDLKDAVAVYRDYEGKLKTQQSYVPTKGRGAAWGAIWGSLIGTIVAIPFTGGASVAAAAAAIAGGALSGGAVGATAGALNSDWWKSDFGIDNDFVNAVATLIRPGDSAIFARITAENPEVVAAHFEGYGGTVLRSSLTPEQTAKLERYLNSRTAA
jgi:uncharacterized membrane protein